MNKKVNKKLSAVLLASIMVAAVAVASPAGKAQAAFSQFYNFQQTTKPFVAQATQGSAAKLSRVFGDCPCQPILNNYYARLASSSINTGAPGAGQATWMMAALPVAQAGPGMAYSVSLSWTSRLDVTSDSAGSGKGASPIAYAGAAPPSAAKDFSTVSQAAPMSAKWATYKYSTVLVPELSPNVYFALGWNGISSAIDVDCVTVTIVPVAPGTNVK